MNKVIYDYLTFTTKIHNLNGIIEFLGFQGLDFQQLKGRYLYQDRLHFGNGVNIMYNGREDMGICVELSGQGCREFETYGNGDYQKIFDMIIENWSDKAEKRQANITRLDVAYDDFDGILDLDYFVTASKNHLYVSRLRKRRIYIDCDDGELDSYSVVHGSERQSNVFIRIYDKLYEQLSKGNNVDDVINHWVRCELQLKDDCARGFIKLGGDIRSNYFDVLNNYLRYIVPFNDDNKRHAPTSPEWLRFIETWNTVSVFDKPGTNYNISKLDNLVFNQMGGAVSTMVDVMGVDKFVNELNERRKGKPLNSKYREIKRQAEKSDGITDYLNKSKKHGSGVNKSTDYSSLDDFLNEIERKRQNERKNCCGDLIKSTGDPKVDELLKGLGLL